MLQKNKVVGDIQEEPDVVEEGVVEVMIGSSTLEKNGKKAQYI